MDYSYMKHKRKKKSLPIQTWKRTTFDDPKN